MPDIRVYCHALLDEIDATSEVAQLKVRVTASPIDSAANKAVLKFTACLAAHRDPRSR